MLLMVVIAHGYAAGSCDSCDIQAQTCSEECNEGPAYGSAPTHKMAHTVSVCQLHIACSYACLLKCMHDVCTKHSLCEVCPWWSHIYKYHK